MGFPQQQISRRSARREGDSMSDRIQGLHHITLCTGTAQGDVDFFVKTLGLRLMKRTLLYDGVEPIYHLYFGDEMGTPGNLTTTFPWRRTGRKARAGTGQIGVISYTVPNGSHDFWVERFTKAKVPINKRYERFGQKVLQISHPECGIVFELVEDDSDKRKPWKSSYGVPEQYAIRGFHSWTVSLRDIDDMHFFMNEGWNHKSIGKDGAFTRYVVDEGGPAKTVDLLLEPERAPGNWSYGEGMVHHGAFGVPNMDVQDRVKAEVEGLGFTDVSERKDRTYFKSVYVRTPAGALFEAAHSIGFTVDEPKETLGTEFIISPQFKDQREALLKRLNDPIDI
jgi:hydroquinone 1,2-dioxygenase/2,6-dichloro-p-hydroquinone 1,2-dioxygenase/glyoxalase family protein